MPIVIAAVIAYLLGAVPVGLIVGRLTKGIDLREYGSHRTGATNALRTLGAKAAALVFLLDVTKGVAAVLIARTLGGGDAEWAAAVAGVAAIVGHNWSVFIGFSGGRGVATSAGALGAVTPVTLLIVFPIVALALWMTRYVSLGSILGAALAPVVTAGLVLIGLADLPAVGYTVASGLLVIGSHADNIARLRAGTEPKLGGRP